MVHMLQCGGILRPLALCSCCSAADANGILGLVLQSALRVATQAMSLTAV
jgi:hypothetical protein